MVMLISEDSNFMTGCRNKSCVRVENDSDCAGAVIVLEILSSISPEVAWVKKDGGEVDDDDEVDDEVDDDDDEVDDDAMDVGLQLVRGGRCVVIGELCCCCWRRCTCFIV